MSNATNSARLQMAIVPGGNGATSAYLTWVDAAGASHDFYPDGVLSEQWDEPSTATEHPVEDSANVADHVRVGLEKCTLTIFASNEPIGPNNWDTPILQAVSLQGEDIPGSGSLPSSATAKVWDAELAAKGAALALGGGIGALIGGAAGGSKGGVIGNAVGEAAGAIVGALIQGHEKDVTFPISPQSIVSSGVTGQAQIYQFASPQDYVELTIQLFRTLKNAAQIFTLNGSKQSCQSMVIEAFSYTRTAEEGTGATITLGLKEIRFVQTQVTTSPLPSMPGAATPVKKGMQNQSDATPAQQQSVLTSIGQGGAALLAKLASFAGFTP